MTRLLGDMYARSPRPQAAVLPPPLPVSIGARPEKDSTIKDDGHALLDGVSGSAANVTSTADTVSGIPHVEASKSTHSWSSPSQVSLSPGQDIVLHRADPWSQGLKLGDLTQGATTWGILSPRESFRDIIMFKKTEHEAGMHEMEILKRVSHRNIMKLCHVYTHEELIYLGFEYCRHTLQELLHVHLQFQELHLRAIAQSVRKMILQHTISHSELTILDLSCHCRDCKARYRAQSNILTMHSCVE